MSVRTNQLHETNLIFLFLSYNKHLINRDKSDCMGEYWPRSCVQTSLRSVCTYDLGQDCPIQTSCSVKTEELMIKILFSGLSTPRKIVSCAFQTEVTTKKYHYLVDFSSVYGDPSCPPPRAAILPGNISCWFRIVYYLIAFHCLISLGWTGSV